MPSVAVIGAQWGDEGKGSVIARLGPQANMDVRYNGGGNSGHKTGVEGVYFNIVPSGLLYPHVQNIIAPGVVYDPVELIGEVNRHIGRGLKTDNLYLSTEGSVTMPHHYVLELLEELDATPEFRIGTTKKAVGPTIRDFHGRYHDVRTRHLLDIDELARRIRFTVPRKNEEIKMLQERIKRLIKEGQLQPPTDSDMQKALHAPPFSPDDLTEKYYAYGRQMRELMEIADTVPLVYDALRRDDNVLFEGAQGTLLDVRHGETPFVTSSHTIAATAGLAGGVGLKVGHTLGVVKAYSTRVGNGEFPTEIHGGVADEIRKRADEKGTTTGRPRSIGWLHGPYLKRAQQLNRFDGIAIIGLNVLSGLELKVYTGGLDGYIDMATWPEFDLARIKEGGYDSLPKGAGDYISWMQTFMDDVPVDMVALGFRPDETLVLRDVFVKKK